MIKKEELGDTLYLFNTSKKEILSDLIKNYDFHKPINKAFEIKHRSSSKNFALYMNTTTSSIHQYLIQNKVPLKKRNLKLSFWSLIDAITTL